VELKEDDYFRHLGNIQNAQGNTPAVSAGMYGGSTQYNIYNKVARSMSSLASRNITIGGCMQILQAVVVRQILYPTTFGNMNATMIHTMQNQIQAVIKKKLRYPRHMKNDVLYDHEQAGGIGIDMMEDLVNVNRLMLVIACLDQGGEMEVIMRGAVDRLRKYAGINECPRVENVTKFTVDR
jgi:hypothetical protein